MNEIVDTLIDGFFEHWAKVIAGAVLMGIGWLIGWFRARKRWQKKEFFERINFSLNSIQGGKLRIRTLMEMSVEDVFLNKVAVNKLLNAATQTSTSNPIAPLPQDDYWFFLNAALNEVSEKFAEGFIRRDVGQSVEAHNYKLCLTNEFDGAIRTRKIRAMLVRSDLLDNLPEEMPELESPNHQTRWRTLKFMAKRMESHPHQFLDVELVI